MTDAQGTILFGTIFQINRVFLKYIYKTFRGNK